MSATQSAKAKRKAKASAKTKAKAKPAPAIENAASTDEKRASWPTCFVVMGFGTKVDPKTGRKINLDKSYERLIKPAFDRAKINAFRAIDVNLTGSIDKIMYYWLFHADYVIADISTLNANAMYELGVRHAQKPGTCIIMGEDGLFPLPFDLSHFILFAYKHLGDDIADDEAERFTDMLAGKLDQIKQAQEEGEYVDSPVYTYLEGMEPPTYVKPSEEVARLKQELAAARDEPDAEDVKKGSIAIIKDAAEEAKSKKDFATAISLFRTALEKTMTKQSPQGDDFLRQRLALVTYKSKDKDSFSDDERIEALKAGEEILQELKPDVSTDPETLGLSGAINKRLYERTEEREYLDRSLYFYERGFYIAQDYYNGINVAYVYNQRADIEPDLLEAITYYGHAKLLRKKVAEICRELIASDTFSARDDKPWIYTTLAEAHFGAQEDAEAEKVEKKIETVFADESFVLDSFLTQKQKLLPMMERFQERIAHLDGEAAAASTGESADGAQRAAALAPTEEESSVVAAQAPVASPEPIQPETVVRQGDGVMALDLGQGTRPVKSIQFNIEYE